MYSWFFMISKTFYLQMELLLIKSLSQLQLEKLIVKMIFFKSNSCTNYISIANFLSAQTLELLEYTDPFGYLQPFNNSRFLI